MSAPKFTAGPWYVADSAYGLCIGAKNEDGARIRLADMPNGETDPETKSNATLLAAAPDLYAACKAVSALGDVNRPDSIDLRVTVETIRMIRAALAKAEGGGS